MKPLKEIGTLIKPEFESMTQFEPFLHFSLEERRELVRRVWDWCMENYGLVDINENKSSKFEEYLKSEGL